MVHIILEVEQDPFYMFTSAVMELRQLLLTAPTVTHFLPVIHMMLA